MSFEPAEIRLLEAARAMRAGLAQEAPEAERACRISAERARAFDEAGLMRLLVPKSLGGLEVRPRVFAEVLYELGRGDGAGGWVVMTGSTTGLLLAYLEREAAGALADAGPLAGIFAPSGKATPVEGGYRVSGRWRYGSGSQNAAAVMGGALVMTDAGPRRLESGGVEIRSCFFERSDVRIEETWRVSGLRGTGSHDVIVEDVFVPNERTACLVDDAPNSDGELYRFPPFGLLATGVAAVGLGIARAALDDLRALAVAKKTRGGKRTMADSELLQVRLATAEGELAAARALMGQTLDEAFATATDGAVTPALQAQIRLAATHAARASVRVVDAAYEAAGGASIWDAHPLSRRFRDVHVMSQHIMVAPDTLKPVARIALGLATDTSQL